LGASALFAAVVAPAAFAVLPSRSLAGALVGRVLPVLFVAGIGVAVIGLLLDRAAAGIMPRVRRAALVLVAVACAIAQFVVAPRIERVRRQIDGPIEQLAPDDPRRSAFGRLHAVSVAWLGLAMVGAAATVVLASVAPGTRRTPRNESLTVAAR
jgi:hypothetical protein